MTVPGREANEVPWILRFTRRRWAQTLVALVCAFAASHAQTTASKIREPRRSNQALAGGKRAFESVCASCHGLNGKGGERAPDIATKPEVVRLSDNETSKNTAAGDSPERNACVCHVGPRETLPGAELFATTAGQRQELHSRRKHRKG